MSDPTRAVLEERFLARLQRLAVRVAAARGRDETGQGAFAGERGDEFAGHRPYRAGEDLRDFDWELYGRLERGFVRVRRRTAGERWAVLLDTSASMGLGAPGKLQLAAEVATALAFAGLDAGATVALLSHGESGGVEAVRLRKPRDLGAWLEFVHARRARLTRPTRELLADRRANAASRVFVVGDLLDLAPADVLALARRGRRVAAVRVLAPHEVAPAAEEGVEWLDPERGERLDMRVGDEALGAYERALEARLEAWRIAFARHGQRCVAVRSDADFEDVARRVLA